MVGDFAKNLLMKMIDKIEKEMTRTETGLMIVMIPLIQLTVKEMRTTPQRRTEKQ